MTNDQSLLEAVKSLRPQTLEVRLRSPRKTSDYVFKGCSLWDYARSRRMFPEVKQQGSFSNLYFVVKAEDGMTVVVSFAEVSPSFTSRKVLLAYEQDGEPVRAGVRLVVPGDDLGGRSVYGVRDIEARSVPYTRVAAEGPSSSVDLLGDIDRPRRVSVEELRDFPSISVETPEAPGHRKHTHPARTFSGVPVYQLLEHAGIQLDEAIHEHFLRKIVVARSADGYAVVLAGGEIEPRFLNAPAIVATGDAGVPLGPEDGGVRLVAGQDNAVSRSIRSLVSLELREA